jgi:hypothetical protein
MMICRLCGLTVNDIPENAIQIGKLYRFVDGSFHFLRKKMEPRTGPRPRKHRPDEVPQESTTVPSTPPIMGRGAHNVPAAPEKTEQPIEPEPPTVDEVPGETAMSRAFRLSKLIDVRVDWNYEMQSITEKQK